MKIVRACVRSILMPPTSHIASLNRHTPKFSGAWNWPGVNRLASMAFHSQITQIRVRFVVIFGKESIFLAKRSVFAYSISHFFWKILVWRFIWYIWGPSMCILWPVRFFVTLWFATGSISWNHVVKNGECIRFPQNLLAYCSLFVIGDRKDRHYIQNIWLNCCFVGSMFCLNRSAHSSSCCSASSEHFLHTIPKALVLGLYKALVALS